MSIDISRFLEGVISCLALIRSTRSSTVVIWICDRYQQIKQAPPCGAWQITAKIPRQQIDLVEVGHEPIKSDPQSTSVLVVDILPQWF